MLYTAYFSFAISEIPSGANFTIVDLEFRKHSEFFASTVSLKAIATPYTKLQIPLFVVCGNKKDRILSKIQTYVKESVAAHKPTIGDLIVTYHLAVSKRRLDLNGLIDHSNLLGLEYMENCNSTLVKFEPIYIYRYQSLQGTDIMPYMVMINKTFAYAEEECDDIF